MRGQGTEIPDFEFAAQQLIKSEEPTVWRATTEWLDDIFRAHADPKFVDDKSRQLTKKGYALYPAGAADCLKNFPSRTAQFVKGLHAAICAAQQRFTERPIRILYAGCGPFATLASIVAPLFKEGEIEFTALDIYETSVNSARRVTECLGQTNKFKEIKRADATSYKADERRPHIIITETMQPQLLTEPQPQITANLGDQMVDGGIFLPELVSVKAFSGNAQERTFNGLPVVYEAEELGTIFELRPDIATRSKNERGEIDDEKLIAALSIDRTFEVKERARQLSHLVLETRVQIFNGHVLTPNDLSGITGRIVAGWFPVENPTHARISYVAGMNNSIVFEWWSGSRYQAHSFLENVQRKQKKTSRAKDDWLGLDD